MFVSKSPLCISIFFLIASFTTSLLAMPLGSLERPVHDWDTFLHDTTEMQQQGRLRSEGEHQESEPAAGSLIAASNFSTQQNENSVQGDLTQGDPTKNKIVPLTREQIFAKLREAFRKAYAQGDETDKSWKEVARLIEELRPENNVERNLKGGKTADEAVAEQTEYHFFYETLPAIKKTSVVAALRRPNNFQTAELVEKAAEVKKEWEEGKNNFLNELRSNQLQFENDAKENPDESFREDTQSDLLISNYEKQLGYQVERWEIEKFFCAIHHGIIEDLKRHVCKINSEGAKEQTEIHQSYKRLLTEIINAKETADPAVKDKWDAFHQEAMARCLDDITQVKRINTWKNRSQLIPLMRNAERAHWQAEKASVADKEAAWERAAAAHKVALIPWQERKTKLEQFQQHVGDQKRTLGLSILSATEKEIAAALVEAEQAIENVNELLSTIPLKILKAAMNHTLDLYQIASEQDRIEKKLKGNGNPALARYNKEKYLALARDQCKKTEQLMQEFETKFQHQSVFAEKIESFKEENRGL